MQNAAGQDNMMTPEAMENMKVDEKLNDIKTKKALAEDPSIDLKGNPLLDMLKPQRPKLKPTPKMRVFSNNGELLGEGKVSKG